MKKTFRFVFAVVAVLAAASCAKEYIETTPVDEANKVTFNLSLTANPTKTSLASGKTVWAKGDSILFSDGSKYEKVAIPDEFAGKAYAEVDVDGTKINANADTLYAVYPPEAFKSASKGGVVALSVQNSQSGNFEQANICVGMAKDYHFAMSNATSVLKFSVPEGVQTVVLSAASTDTLAGTIAATCSLENPITVKASSPLKSIKVVTGGLDGDYYVSVIPGTYSEFTLMALSLDGKSQKKTASNKTLAVNDLADLGLIGNEMAGATLAGSGSEDDPFLLKDVADMTTLATSVCNGLAYTGQYFKLNNDIEDVTTPIGTFDQVPVSFEGIFDGANHTVTLAMGSDESEEGYLALFGSLGEGAVVKDLTIAGTVTSKGNYVAGLAAYSNFKDEGVSISNVNNTASVTGTNFVGGLIAYGTCNKDGKAVVDNCHNTGEVTSLGHTAAGIAAYSIHMDITNCDNAGLITTKTANGAVYTLNASKKYFYGDLDGVSNQMTVSDVTRGTGGIVGVAYNSRVKNTSNTGTVTAVSKAGGIAGNIYWGSVTESNNSGVISTSNDFAGGLAGMIWVQGNVSKCVNTGTVSGKAVVGGIVGLVNAQERASSAYMTIQDCENKGTVTSISYDTTNEADQWKLTNLSAAGGIVGAYKSFNKDWCNILACVNSGKVSGEGQACGGILGYMGNPRNGSDWGSIDGCTNNGEVASNTYRAGGIVGVAFDRYATCHYAVRNCINKGKVTAPYVVSGIVAWAGAKYPDANTTKYPMKIYNCLNLGEVVFTNATVTNAYVGTIVAYCNGVDVENCFNAGVITAPENASADTKCAGVLVGQANNMNTLKYMYAAYDETAYNALKAAEWKGAGILYGSSMPANSTASTLCMVNLEGLFDVDVIVGSTTCSDPIAALNAWVGTSTTYKKWVDGENGPELAQ